MWGKIVSTITGPVAEYFVEKQKLKYDLKIKKLEGKIKVEEAKANRAIKVLEADQEWEAAQIQNSGWKDEWVIILLSIPLVLVFIPWAAPFIQEGFTILATTPEWYRWLIMLIFTAVYGIRIWRRQDK